MFLVVCQFRINLIGDHDKVVLARESGDALDVLLGLGGEADHEVELQVLDALREDQMGTIENLVVRHHRFHKFDGMHLPLRLQRLAMVAGKVNGRQATFIVDTGGELGLDVNNRVVDELETDPARFLPDVTHDDLAEETVVHIDLNRPMSEIRAPMRTKATGVRSVRSTRKRSGRSRITVADSTHGMASSWRRRSASGTCSS